jgi:hypothetical protein
MSYKAQQVDTRTVTVQTILSDTWFERGLNDARQLLAFDWRIGADASHDVNAQWNYERGRLLGRLAPLTMPLWIGNRLNPKAVALARLAFERKLVI